LYVSKTRNNLSQHYTTLHNIQLEQCLLTTKKQPNQVWAKTTTSGLPDLQQKMQMLQRKALGYISTQATTNKISEIQQIWCLASVAGRNDNQFCICLTLYCGHVQTSRLTSADTQQEQLCFLILHPHLACAIPGPSMDKELDATCMLKATGRRVKAFRAKLENCKSLMQQPLKCRAVAMATGHAIWIELQFPTSPLVQGSKDANAQPMPFMLR
jgi:hypothetical protein